MKLEYAWQGPKRGVVRVADRAVLLAHGAGADMHAATLRILDRSEALWLTFRG